VADFTLPPANTLIVGMTGSGKSTFAYRYLVNANAACRFIFDDLGRAATRLNIAPVFFERQCEGALASRWVIFNPHRMFPGATKDGFRWFCQWVYAASRRGEGKKLLLVDEVWQWQSNMEMPRELALCVQTGREENLELVCATQLPQKVNASVTGQSTELVCFRLTEPLALKEVKDLGGDPEKVKNLPLGAFISYNRLTGATVSGKLF
tara:strand:- start:74 stop:697 length:624 start_codon:yes stop_codon:yes gene_type:complete